MSQTKQIASITSGGAPVVAGMDTPEGWDLLKRQSSAFASSSLVPADYQAWPTVNGERKENPAASANCMIALNMSHRLGMDALMVMQNLYIVHGKPGWSAQFVIAAINNCGRFRPLEFEFEGDWNITVKVNGSTVPKVKCRAHALERSTNTVRRGPWVSMEMAVLEGWYGKRGSKWQTMPELMLHYRSASLFGRLYASELLMGYQTADEIQDVIDVTPERVVSNGPAAEPTADIEDAVVETKMETNGKSGAEGLKDKLKAKAKAKAKATTKAEAEPEPKAEPEPSAAPDALDLDLRGVLLDPEIHTGARDDYGIWECKPGVDPTKRLEIERVIDAATGETMTLADYQSRNSEPVPGLDD